MHSPLRRSPPRLANLGPSLLLLSAVALHAETPLPQLERLRSSPVLRHLAPNPLPHTLVGTTPGTGSDTVSRMFVPPGFRAELVAAEPAVQQPVAFAIDDRGRLWIAEAHSYPSKRPEGEGQDRLTILEDRDGNGSFETRKVFAERLNLVSGFELGHGGVWVGAAPQLLFLPDRDRNDIPDGPAEVLLDGFGFQDTHECLNSFVWGPDGWLYGIQGVFNLAHIGKPGAPAGQRQELRAGVWRYHPVRHEFEVFAHGGSNPWGLDYDERGQWFMTHCRSYWGRGGTTHVIQAGQFWNQANANYAPFIVANPPADFPAFRNFLLASARYDHGAGGAGAPGSDAIYGGHSHVGTMIYLGDNWPEEYRGHLFTHNLHGHQINQQVNRPWGSGFDTVHAGRDQFFCSDPKYVAIDLQYGPDGAVYFIDWYDQQHCHNPNNERWERGNGRVYRLQWETTYRPVKVDLGALDDARLVELLGHRNEWFVRTARRLLHERATAGKLRPEIVPALGSLFANHLDPAVRLRALWTLHAVGCLTDTVVERALADPDEYVRSWGIQLAAEHRRPSPVLARAFERLAVSDPSQVVRRHLASALSRIEPGPLWTVARALARHGEDTEDRNLPFLLWHGIAPAMPGNTAAALAIASDTPISQLADWIHWYAATLGGEALEASLAGFATADPAVLHRRLAGLWLALEPRANQPMPAAWSQIAPRLYQASDLRVRRLAERIAAAFGDASLFPGLRRVLADRTADQASRDHAFAVLGRAQDRESIPTFVGALAEPPFRSKVIPLLGRFDAPEIPAALLGRLASFTPGERIAALETLTGRASYALALLDAVAAKRVPREHVTAFQIRRLAGLRNAEVDRRVAEHWGRIQQTPAEKQKLMGELEKTFDEAPLWAYDARAGREHFRKLCASCHVLGQDGSRVGPELTGAGRNGIRYFLENILDPNAVVGADFQLTTVETKSGDVISGLKLSENDSAVTLRTVTAEQIVPRKDIREHSTNHMSLMPEGLLESLPPREQIELLKYLTEN